MTSGWLDSRCSGLLVGTPITSSLVDLPELTGLGQRGAGHAGKLVVELEEVLQRDGGQRLILFFNRHAFFGLDRLVQAVTPLAPFHQSARELVDDHDLAILDHVIHVALVEVMGLQRVVDQVRPLHVAGRVEAVDAGQLFGLADTFVRQAYGVFLLFDLEVRVLLQAASDLVGPLVLADVVLGGAGDDQRSSGFVDQDVVDFVDDGERKGPLGLLVALGDNARRRSAAIRMLSRR